jgi:hypothetical protein
MPRPSRTDAVRDGVPADPARQRLLTRDNMILLLGQCEQLPFSVIRHIGSVPSLYDIP